MIAFKLDLFKTLIISALIVIPALTHGQKSTNAAKDSIRTYPDKVFVTLHLDTQVDSYDLRQDGRTLLSIRPNQNYKLSFAFNYKFISVSYGFVPGFIGANDDDALKGDSKFSDLTFRFFFGKVVQSLRYTRIKGYYVENTEDFLPDWIENENPFLTIPNLTNTRYEGSTSYVFNSNFSYQNILFQNEWQQRSAGSFIPSLRYNYQTYIFSFDTQTSEESNINLELLTSYYYTWVIKKNWFIAANLSPGLGVKFVDATSEENNMNTREKEVRLSRILAGGLQLGYSSDRVVIGARLDVRDTWYNEDANSVVENDQLYGLVYLGYRFDPPKFLSKGVEKLLSKIKK